MEIETYEAVSLDEQGGNIINEEVSEEALALIESLGLKGQKNLVKSDDADGETVERRIPYRRMTLEEQRILAVLCPVHTEISAYDSEPLALRVLQVAAHATPMFKRLEVWHPEDSRIDDPVLVGMKADEKWTWQETPFILARWGRTLVSWDEMRAQALAAFKPEVRGVLQGARSKIDAALAGHEDLCDAYMRGQKVEWPTLDASYAR